MTSQSPSKQTKYLFLVDEGWRCEKKDLLLYLKGRIDFDVATHEPLAYEALKDDFKVILLEKKPLKRGLKYSFLMFFAKELDTNLVRYRKRMTYDALSWPMRILHRVRNLAEVLRLRFYSYTRVLEILYADSEEHTDLLSSYDALVFLPVEVQDKRIIFEARNRGLKRICWVYSWDNPMKDNEFVTDADLYLVWNQENADDLKELHGIPSDTCRLVGPIQFDFLREKTPSATDGKDNYVLYVCTLGHERHLEQETNVVLQIRRILNDVAPDVKLAVRPYPFRRDKDFTYEKLKGEKGIELLEFGELDRNQIVIDWADLEEKYRQIDRAKCFIHFGSTMGLEASFTNTPILQMAFNFAYDGPDHLSITQPLKNEHLKHMIDAAYPNTLQNEEQLRHALDDILAGRIESYRPYTEKLQQLANPTPDRSYRESFCQALAEL